MAKVYVITKGCYSDYHICSVTLDKEKAESLRVLFDGSNSRDETRIEEFDTESHTDLLAGRKPYRVSFRKNGDLCSVNEDVWGIEYFKPGINEFPKLNECLVVYLYANSKIDAIQIAAEKRALYLATKEGIV